MSTLREKIVNVLNSVDGMHTMNISRHEIAGAKSQRSNWRGIPAENGDVLDVDVDVIQAFVEQVSSLAVLPT